MGADAAKASALAVARGRGGGSVTDAAAIPLALATRSGIWDSPLPEGACASRARNRRWPHIEERAAKEQNDGGKTTLTDSNQDGNGGVGIPPGEGGTEVGSRIRGLTKRRLSDLGSFSRHQRNFSVSSGVGG